MKIRIDLEPVKRMLAQRPSDILFIFIMESVAKENYKTSLSQNQKLIFDASNGGVLQGIDLDSFYFETKVMRKSVAWCYVVEASSKVYGFALEGKNLE